MRSNLSSEVLFWEGMAHKQFREEAHVVRRTGQKIGAETRTLLDWFTDFFKHHADARDTLEQVSASVFDMTSALFSERSLSKVAPNFKKMLEQVAAWEMLKPMEAPVPAIHEHLYWELSKDAHLIPSGLGEPQMEFPHIHISLRSKLHSSFSPLLIRTYSHDSP